MVGLAAGTVSRFLDGLRNIETFQEDTEEDWDDAQIEAFLADEQMRLYEMEMKVYSELREYQGRLIPKLLAAVSLELSLPVEDTPGEIENDQNRVEPLLVKGILLQYIEASTWGACQTTPPSRADKRSWTNHSPPSGSSETTTS